VTCAFTGGMSMTCRRSAPVTSPLRRDFPQHEHVFGRCRTTLSGRSLSAIVVPGWPSGRPGFRPDFPRSDFGDGFASPSDDGGFEEFREFAFTCAARASTRAPSTASRSSSTAIRASRSASSSRSRAFAARSPPSPLSGTPRTSGTPERCHDSPCPANIRQL
jgi:hypothetical protein